MTAVVVIGDVHGNARALRAALDQAHAGPLDRLVFVGDLLTYGHDVREVIDLVHAEQQRSGATLLVGNHDHMYIDLARGEGAYYERLPDWIKHSVDKTLTLLDIAAFRDGLRWQSELEIERMLIAHASPYGAGDWTYLNAAAEQQRASEALATRGLRGGVFGHTHRARWYTGSADSATTDVPLATTLVAPDGVAVVANAGAVGQPRDQRGCAVILRLALGADRVAGTFERVDYDVEAHLAALRASGLPDATVQRLCGFFKTAS